MANEEIDPYTVLGVDRNASDADIRAAYHALVAKYHPDKHQGNPLEGLAAEKMAEVNRAYEMLSDKAKRSAHDSRARPWPRAAGGYSTAGPGVPAGKPVRWMRLLGLLLLVPLLLRFGGFLVRLIVGLVRGGAELTAVARGTPLAMVLFVAAVLLLVYFLIRRRSRKRRH
jgi:curved DNA-binding protein CbpA